MSGVDDRVVHMQFDNAEFERRLASTLSSIATLQKSLDFSNSRKGLDDLSAAGSRFNMGDLAGKVEGVSGKFLALATVGITTLANITTKALQSGAAVVKAFTFAPVMDGFHEFETNMGSIQTILANTKSKGTTLDNVNDSLQELNTYSDKTIYNFTEMARNIGTFTAAGVGLKESTASIKGIANLAALSGSNSEQASTAMYQLSQAIASGSVKLQDWNSVVNAGMGGETFQKALFESGKAMKTLKDVPMGETFEDWKKKGNSFRDSLQDGWVTSEVLTKTLNSFTGDLTVAQIQALGYTKEQAQQLYDIGQTGLKAATQVKTLTQLISTVKEAVGSGWTQTFQILFGNFDDSVKLFTSLSNAIGGFVQRSAKARNDLLEGWAKGGGRLELINAFIDGIKALGEVVKPIKEAFREFFPRKTSDDLLQMTHTFADLTGWLHPLPETVDKIKRTFAGLFAVADIVINVFLEVRDAIFNLIGDLRPAGDGIFGFAANMGDLAVKLDDFLVNGGRLHAFFLKIDHVVDATVGILRNLTGSLSAFIYTLKTGFTEDEGTPIERVALAIRHFFEVFKDSGNVADSALGRVHDRFDGIASVLSHLSSVGEGVRRILDSVFGVIGNWLSTLGKSIAESLKPGDFDAAVDAVNVGLLGGIVVLLKKFLSGGLNLDVGHGLFSQIKESLDQLTGTLKAMQTELKAKALKEIAIAIAVLTASIVVLSLIDSAALSKSMTALAVGFAELVSTMKVLDEIASNVQGAAKLGLLAGAMTLLATAALILSGAVALLGSMSVETLARGLGALATALVIMIASIKMLEGDAAGVLAGSAAMVAMATAMTIMAGAVALFGHMSWAEMGKGLLGVAAALGIVAGIMLIMPVSSTLAAGLAMIPLATGIAILAGAVRLFGSIPLGEMVKGMVGMAAALAIIAAAMNAMPISLPITAAGLILVGIALGIMAEGVKLMGSMDLGTLAKGLIGIAALMTILALAVNAMSGAMGGAIALLVVSESLKVLSGVLIALSQLSWGDLLKGLVAIAAVLTVLGLAALVLEPVIPALLGLGVAMTLVGLGFTLFGAGAWMVAKAIQALAAAGKAGVDALIEALKMILTALPEFISTLVSSLFDSTGDILNAAQLMLKILTVLLLQILDTVIKLAPKIAEALVAIVTAGLVLIRAKFPDVVATAFDLLIVFLKGIRDNIDRVTQLAIDILVRFIDTLIANEELLVNEGIDLLLGFLAAIAGRVNDVIEGGQNLLLSFIAGMINYVYRIIDFAVSVVIALVQTIAGEAERIVTAGADILIHFAQSLADNTYRVAAKGVDIVLAFLNAIGDQAIRLATGAADALTHFLNGLADAIRDKAPEIREAGVNIAGAIISGITGGLSDKVGDVVGGAEDLGKRAIGGFLHAIHAKSPSRDFYKAAGFMAQGVVLGLKDDTLAENAAVDHAERIVRAFSETLSRIPNTLEGLDANPVITPVLDLSKVKTAASGLGALMPSPIITPTASLGQARLISTTADTSKDVPESVNSGPSEIKFEQNIYSPTELTTNQIYRSTKSQFAQAKEELGI